MSVRQAIAIARAGAGTARSRLEPAVRRARHRQRPARLRSRRSPSPAPGAHRRKRVRLPTGSRRTRVGAEADAHPVDARRTAAPRCARRPASPSPSTARSAPRARRCRAAAASADCGGGRRKSMAVAVGLSSKVRIVTLPSASRIGAAQHQRPLLGCRSTPRLELSRRDWSNQAMSAMPGAGCVLPCRKCGWRSTGCSLAQRDQPRDVGGQRNAPAAMPPCSSRARRSRCPGNRHCCCRSACGRTRRRPAASACRAARNTVASIARLHPVARLR